MDTLCNSKCENENQYVCINIIEYELLLWYLHFDCCHVTFLHVVRFVDKHGKMLARVQLLIASKKQD